ncbi:protein SUPPRESSOR OF MAX2 1-like [Chenopodium quinoa]|uniref:protein SUPPRESSOR OF MAX2 1-like n=1 Tax=Chenopodium quinoa TaxID=63459 RepID=UPI000B787DD6|nr:protein SUPPRESSOR OF MAX2 1-like [Chenopodium quinoa]
MRGGLSAIQQTLTPEAASVLSHSIAEAGRRNHGQTTPLHVAATLLSSPTGFLRQACIRSHPNSSHPLQCRALELCFSVALERLPTAQTGGNGSSGSVHEPPISNALMAALKRAQAHQRRGCPEQQQQPLLAVKVELEQLMISILDDPSVSRVMREASFSSPAVKAAIEQVVSTQPNSGPRIGLGFRSGPGGPSPPGAGLQRNLYLNPRLQQQQQQHQGNGMLQGKGDDVKKVMDILSRSKKRNPILVGESGPEEVVREVIKRIDKDEIRDGVLQGVEVISVEKELGSDRAQLGSKLMELGALIEKKMVVNCKGGNGVIIDLGDLKWLVDQPASQGVSEAARGAVTEMGKILRKYGEGGKIWFIGTATCETYLRCQVYHTAMENEWDLQVVSIVARPPLTGILPRLGSNGGILSSSVECLSPMKGFPMPASSLTRRVSENVDPTRRFSCCPQCTEKYDQELANVVAGQTEKQSSDVKSDATRQSLPPWLQNAKSNSDETLQCKEQDMILRQKTQELQKKWRETCLQLHPSFYNNMSSERIVPSPLSMTGLYNPNLLVRQPFQPKLQQQPRGLGDGLQLNLSSPVTQQLNSGNPKSTPGSPVRTELVLGPTKTMGTAQDDGQKDGLKDFLGCISSESADKPVSAIPEDVDSFKRLLKGLIAKVWWQTDAASAVAAAVTQCRLGSGKRRVGGSKGDIWLLFSGPDRMGKKKMAAALSELVSGVGPIIISLGSRRDGDESEFNFRGKTVIDRIVEAVRRNPFSVIMLQDIDEADMLVRGNVKRAMERGRISDSHGREISLGNVVFIVTSSWMPERLRNLSDGVVTLDEEKMTTLASGGWQLKISLGEKVINAGKRSPSWLSDNDQERSTKQRKEEIGQGNSFDLNQMADTDDDRLDGSHNSSDLTVDHEEEHGHENRGSPTTSSEAPNELLTSVDEAIIFKAVDLKPIRQNIERSILSKFSSTIGESLLVKIEGEALEKILSGIWLGQTTLESWIEKTLAPSINQLRTKLPSLATGEGKVVARLELDQESDSRSPGDWLPGRIMVVSNAQ